MDRDGLFFEREGLLLEQQVVLLALLALQTLRPLRLQQVLSQPTVKVSHFVGGRGGHFGDAVLRSRTVALHRGIERLALGLEAALQGRHQPHAAIGVPRRSRQRKLCTGGKQLHAVGALSPGGSISSDDLPLPELLARTVARSRGELQQLLSRVDGARYRRRVVVDETLQRHARLGKLVRLFVELRRGQQRLTLHCDFFARRRGDALEFGGGVAWTSRFRVGDSQVPGNVRAARVLGIVAPIPLEHRNRTVPLLQIHELRRCVKLGGGSYHRVGR